VSELVFASSLQRLVGKSIAVKRLQLEGEVMYAIALYLCKAAAQSETIGETLLEFKDTSASNIRVYWDTSSPPFAELVTPASSANHLIEVFLLFLFFTSFLEDIAFHDKLAEEIESYLLSLIDNPNGGFVVLRTKDRSPTGDIAVLMVDRAPSDIGSPREIHIAIYLIKNWDKGNPNLDAEIQKASHSLAALRKRDSLKDVRISSSFILVHDSPLAAGDKCGFDNILQLNRAMAKRLEAIRDPFPDAPMYPIPRSRQSSAQSNICGIYYFRKEKNPVKKEN